VQVTSRATPVKIWQSEEARTVVRNINFDQTKLAIGNLLRLPDIVDVCSRSGVGGNHFPGNRAHDLIIDTDLPTPFCILLGMGIVLAVIFDKVGNKNICVPFDFHQNQTIHPKIKHIVGFSRPTR